MKGGERRGEEMRGERGGGLKIGNERREEKGNICDKWKSQKVQEAFEPLRIPAA